MTAAETATQVEVRPAAPAVKFYVRNEQPFARPVVLAVGEEVGYFRMSRFSSANTIREGGVCKVARVLKTQVVLENGMRFNTSGEQVGAGDDRRLLITPAALDARMASEKAQAQAAAALSELRKAVDGLRWVTGVVSAETKDELAALVAALAVHPAPAAN